MSPGDMTGDRADPEDADRSEHEPDRPLCWYQSGPIWPKLASWLSHAN